MNICITGALGHIGSKLIREFSLKNVNKIYLVDNFLTQRYVSLFDLPSDKYYSFCECDILSEKIEKIIKDSDVVVHLAAVTNAEASFHNKEQVKKINEQGIEHIAGLCAKYDSALLFPSSTSVYGSQESLVDENCKKEDLKPQSPYAESKLYAERLLKILKEEKKLRYTIFRLGTIFGYSIGMRFHTAVNKFIWQAAMGEGISVWKTALNQKRPYCGLNDCVHAIEHTIGNDIFDGELFNIVTINLTVADIVETIKKFVPSLSLNFVESPIMNQLSYNVCNKRSIARGYKYSDQLEDNIRETLQHLKNCNSHIKKEKL